MARFKVCRSPGLAETISFKIQNNLMFGIMYFSSTLLQLVLHRQIRALANCVFASDICRLQDIV